MPSFHPAARLLLAVIGLVAISACARNPHSAERNQVKVDFGALRQALLARQPENVMVYLPQDVGDYLLMINADGQAQSNAADAPGVRHLLRTVLDEKVAPADRAHLDLQLLLQRLGDHGLLDCREIRDVSLGEVEVNGDHASAKLYFQGNLLPLRAPFLHQGGVWKVDLLSMLPYAEVLMRLDRAVTGKTENQQVAQIVAPLPTL